MTRWRSSDLTQSGGQVTLPEVEVSLPHAYVDVKKSGGVAQ